MLEHISENIQEPWKHYSKVKEARHEKPHVWFHWHELFWRGKSRETENRVFLPEAGGKGEREWVLTKYRVSLGGNKNILKLGSNDGCTMLWLYLKPLNVYFKMGSFRVWKTSILIFLKWQTMWNIGGMSTKFKARLWYLLWPRSSNCSGDSS